MSIERSFLRYRNRLEKIFGKKYRTGNGKNKNSLKRNKVLLEPLEPRILLSDFTYAPAAGLAVSVAFFAEFWTRARR